MSKKDEKEDNMQTILRYIKLAVCHFNNVSNVNQAKIEELNTRILSQRSSIDELRFKLSSLDSRIASLSNYRCESEGKLSLHKILLIVNFLLCIVLSVVMLGIVIGG